MNAYIAAVLLLASFACAENVLPGNTAFGYLANIGIPLAEKIREAEEKAISERIIGGSFSAPGQFNYQVGLLSSIIGMNGRGVCGGSLISVNRVLTAAHCWFDGVNQAWAVEVVLGSTYLFSGGTRVLTSAVALHPSWFPALIRNDIGVIYLPQPVQLSSLINTIALPSGADLNNDFAGRQGVVSGFGLTVNGGSLDGSLRHVYLNIITNSVCSVGFPLILQPSNICTSGVGGVGTCQGDSGGPLAVHNNGTAVQVGVVSFGNALFGGCDSFLPAAFARVTSFIDFINSHL